MSRPRNWFDMSLQERLDWQRQDNARADEEYAREQAEQRAEQASRDAERAQQAAKAARYEAEEQAESYRSEIEELQDALTEVRLERNAAREKCDMLLAAIREHLAITDDVRTCDITNPDEYRAWSARSATAWEKLRKIAKECEDPKT